LFGLGKDRESGEYYASIATAWHVVEPLVGTTEDLEIMSVDMQTVFSSVANEVGFHPIGDTKFDTAMILLKTGKPLINDTELLPIVPDDSVLARGAEIGWLGFPGIAETELCFFHGFISGHLDSPPTYLVDGVAINGVSGGPAFDNRAHVIGLVSSYRPNRIDQHTTLPGLLALMPINAFRYWMQHRMKARVLQYEDMFPESK
jgi:hypothetical protein